MKIYFGSTIFYLTNSESYVTSLKYTVLLSVNSFDELKKEFESVLKTKHNKEIVFVNKNLEQLQSWFISMFTVLEAAGGLVINHKNEYLFIYRNEKWDLPKGKIEKDETVEIAAVREVEEECGITGLILAKKIITTYHIYLQNNKIILKPTHWFEMKTNFIGKLIPQTEEGITKVEWVNKGKISMLLTNTYESIQDVCKCYFN